jgi:hypothetical protein
MLCFSREYKCTGHVCFMTQHKRTDILIVVKCPKAVVYRNSSSVCHAKLLNCGTSFRVPPHQWPENMCLSHDSVNNTGIRHNTMKDHWRSPHVGDYNNPSTPNITTNVRHAWLCECAVRRWRENWKQVLTAATLVQGGVAECEFGGSMESGGWFWVGVWRYFHI